jgi:hypothetical protein
MVVKNGKRDNLWVKHSLLQRGIPHLQKEEVKIVEVILYTFLSNMRFFRKGKFLNENRNLR